MKNLCIAHALLFATSGLAQDFKLDPIITLSKDEQGGGLVVAQEKLWVTENAERYGAPAFLHVFSLDGKKIAKLELSQGIIDGAAVTQDDSVIVFDIYGYTQVSPSSDKSFNKTERKLRTTFSQLYPHAGKLYFDSYYGPDFKHRAVFEVDGARGQRVSAELRAPSVMTSSENKLWLINHLDTGSELIQLVPNDAERTKHFSIDLSSAPDQIVTELLSLSKQQMLAMASTGENAGQVIFFNTKTAETTAKIDFNYVTFSMTQLGHCLVVAGIADFSRKKQFVSFVDVKSAPELLGTWDITTVGKRRQPVSLAADDASEKIFMRSAYPVALCDKDPKCEEEADSGAYAIAETQPSFISQCLAK